MSFQKIILIIALIVLIIMLVVIGIALSKSAYSEVWPPIVGACPDYWVDLSGNGQACFNSHNLGTCKTSANASDTNKENRMMNFNQAPFNSENGTCAKYKWATACKVTWDGITSGVKNPCDTSTTTTT
jgi:hypothetical protein